MSTPTIGSQRSVIGLATNTTLDPTAPGYHWVDQGEVIGSSPRRTDYNAIDPNIAIDVTIAFLDPRIRLR